MDGFTIFCIVLAYAVVGLVVGISLDEDGEDAKDALGAAILWPIFAIISVCSWLIPDEGLSFRQRRKIKYEREMLEIQKARNDETERAMRIIGGV